MKINKSRAENIGIIIIITIAIGVIAILVAIVNGDRTWPYVEKLLQLIVGHMCITIVFIILLILVGLCVYFFILNCNKKRKQSQIDEKQFFLDEDYIKKRLDNNPFRNYWKREDNNPYIPLDIQSESAERHNFYKYFISIINIIIYSDIYIK